MKQHLQKKKKKRALKMILFRIIRKFGNVPLPKISCFLMATKPKKLSKGKSLKLWLKMSQLVEVLLSTSFNNMS
jgi:hypothetical protein